MKLPSFRAVIPYVLSALFVAMPVLSLVKFGLFGWHVRQKSFHQAALELILLGTAIAYLLTLKEKKWKWPAILAVTWLYARHQGIDLTIALAILYVQGITALGHNILRLLRAESGSAADNLLFSAFVGFMSWVGLIFLISLCGFGSLMNLKFAAVLVLGGCLLINRKTTPSLISTFKSHIDADGRRHVVFNAMTIVLPLIAFAKTTVTIDYDSMWYGLNGDHVLFGAGGLFGSEGLIAPVHYYPKFYEALLGPLTGFGSVPITLSLSCVSLYLITIALRESASEFGVDKAWHPATAVAVLSVPALLNVATTAKGDAWALWLFVTACYFFQRYRFTHRTLWLCVSICCGITLTQIRITEIPYAAFLVAFLIMFGLRQRARSASLPQHRDGIVATGVALLTMLTVGLVTLRTYLLAGVPLIAPNFMVSLADHAGMTLHFPVGTLNTPANEHLPIAATVLAYLFTPSTYTLLAIYWTGNIWLLMSLLSLGRRKSSATTPVSQLMLIVALLFPALLFGYKWNPSGGADGNYFLIPIYCLVMLAAMRISRLERSESETRHLLNSVQIVTIASALIALLTGGWAAGIRPFDTTMTRTAFDMQARRSAGLHAAGLDKIGTYLGQLSPDARVFGDAPALESWWLPIRYEPIDVVSWANSALIANADSIRNYVTKDGIEYLIVRRPHSAYDAYTQAISQMIADGALKLVVAEDSYELLKVLAPQAIGFAHGPDGVTLRLVPMRETLVDCSANSSYKARVSWDAIHSPSSTVRLFVKPNEHSPEQLMAESAATGTTETGPWVHQGMTFVLRDAATMASLATLDSPPLSCDRD